MNEYIITEEEVELIEEALKSEPECKPCPYEAAGFKQGVASFLRSHPYQSERYRPVCYPDCENEKHIRKDERDKMLETMFAESPRTEDMLTILKKRYRNEMAIFDYIEMIACEVMALRQAGEP